MIIPKEALDKASEIMDKIGWVNIVSVAAHNGQADYIKDMCMISLMDQLNRSFKAKIEEAKPAQLQVEWALVNGKFIKKDEMKAKLNSMIDDLDAMIGKGV